MLSSNSQTASRHLSDGTKRFASGMAHDNLVQLKRRFSLSARRLRQANAQNAIAEASHNRPTIPFNA
jgi:hypothetical protein